MKNVNNFMCDDSVACRWRRRMNSICFDEIDTIRNSVTGKWFWEPIKFLYKKLDVDG